MSWPEEAFYVPQEVRTWMTDLGACWSSSENQWNENFAAYEQAFPELAAEYNQRMTGNGLPDG